MFTVPQQSFLRTSEETLDVISCSRLARSVWLLLVGSLSVVPGVATFLFEKAQCTRKAHCHLIPLKVILQVSQHHVQKWLRLWHIHVHPEDFGPLRRLHLCLSANSAYSFGMSIASQASQISSWLLLSNKT